MTRKVELRPWQGGYETQRWIGWLNDHEVVRYSEQRHTAHRLGSHESVEWVRAMTQPPNRLWAIHLDDTHIGNIAAAVDGPNKVADLSILIGAKEYWGQGFGLRAWSAAMDELFAAGVVKVEAGCMSANEAMLRVMMRSGMHGEGRREGHFLLDGRRHALVQAAKFAE